MTLEEIKTAARKHAESEGDNGNAEISFLAGAYSMQPKIAELERQIEAWRDNGVDQAMEYGKLDDVAVGMFKKIEELEGKLKIAIGTLETLSVAVNDKVKDPGATLFIKLALDKIREGDDGKAE